MKDLRNFIDECARKLPQEFARVSREVDPRYEISAVIKKLDLLGRHPLVYFEKVKGFSMPVVCNTDSSLAKFGVAFGVPPQEVRRFYNEREEECMRLIGCSLQAGRENRKRSEHARLPLPDSP